MDTETVAIQGCNLEPTCPGYQVIAGTGYYIASEDSNYLDAREGDSVARKYVAYKRQES